MILKTLPCFGSNNDEQNSAPSSSFLTVMTHPCWATNDSHQSQLFTMSRCLESISTWFKIFFLSQMRFPPFIIMPPFLSNLFNLIAINYPSEIERLYLIDPPLSGCDMKTHFNLPCFSALIFRSLTVPTFIPFRAERYEEKHRIQIQPYLVAIIYSKIPISRC